MILKRFGKRELYAKTQLLLNEQGFDISTRKVRVLVDTVLKAIGLGLIEHRQVTLHELGNFKIAINKTVPSTHFKRLFRIKYAPTAAMLRLLEKIEVTDE